MIAITDDVTMICVIIFGGMFGCCILCSAIKCISHTCYGRSESIHPEPQLPYVIPIKSIRSDDCVIIVNPVQIDNNTITIGIKDTYSIKGV